MTTDDAIFSPRPDSGTIAQPTQQKLNDFLENAKKDTSPELHVVDVIRYRKSLSHVENFENRMGTDEARPSAGEQACCGALLHTRFFNRSLLMAVGQYKFHLRQLAAIDFESPNRFIDSAEITGRRLSRRKASDVIRLNRLQELVEERKKSLQKHRSRWDELTAELLDIALYVLENLVKSERLCGRSIGRLADRDLLAKKVRLQVESIKNLLKKRLSDSLVYRTVTTEDVANAKKELEVLSAELHAGVEEDRGRMRAVYEAVRGHVRRCVEDLSDHLENFRGKEIEMDHGHRLLFRRIEQTLVSLVSSYPDVLDLTGDRPGDSKSSIVEDKRQGMVAYTLEEVRKARARGRDRRAKKDRRKGKDPSYTGPERRSGKERRAWKDRRSS